jgi:hypothetical protein
MTDSSISDDDDDENDDNDNSNNISEQCLGEISMCSCN